MKNCDSYIKTGVNRRHFLKGAGVSLLLPKMVSFAGEKAYEHPTRMAFLHVPNGKIMNKWTPKNFGESYEITQTLKPLQKYKKDIQVISGLKHHYAQGNGDGGGDHARAQGTFLTGVQVLKSTKEARNSISVDQVAAQKAGNKTYLPSLELSTNKGRLSGACDTGYSCMYQFNLAWKNETEPLVPESSPAAAFKRLFTVWDPNNPKKSQIRQKDKSVLDFLNASAKTIQKRLAKEDIDKLDQYFTNLREIERKALTPKPKVKAGQLMRDFSKDPVSYSDKIDAHMDIMVLAWEVDATRICTMIVSDEGSNQNFPELGIDGGHHSISHHQNDPEKIAQLEKIDLFYTSRLAHFLNRLSERKVNGKSLLDQSMVLYGCATSDGNRHRHNNLPVLLAGHANGKLNAGVHRKYDDTPMCNLFVNMLDVFGTPVEKFGDSNGRLAKI